MRRQILLDKLSEFLMHEQGGLQLYRVAAGRTRDPDLRAQYERLGRQTAGHRDALVRIIHRLGGDPDYVSPTARLTQQKAEALLQTALAAGPLSAEEIEANDLENILIVETKDHMNWHLLQAVVRTTGDLDVRLALEEAVRRVEAEEDDHVSWARERLDRMMTRLLTLGPAPAPERWQTVLSGPVPPIGREHPAPVGAEFLLETARQAPWGETPIARDMARGV